MRCAAATTLEQQRESASVSMYLYTDTLCMGVESEHSSKHHQRRHVSGHFHGNHEGG